MNRSGDDDFENNSKKLLRVTDLSEEDYVDNDKGGKMGRMYYGTTPKVKSYGRVK